KRPYSGLWEVFGEKLGENILKDPHYSISFHKTEAILIALTSNRLRKITPEFMRTLLNKFTQIYSTQGGIDLKSYFISALNYRLVDHQKGQIKGESFVPFNFFMRLSEVKNNAEYFAETIAKFSKLGCYKQFDFGIRI